MGKPFASELQKIPDTIEWVKSLDLSDLKDFFESSREGNLITIGAGGSYSAADLARACHDSVGGISQTFTPLSFTQSKVNLSSTYVILFTAGGNNADVLEAVGEAIAREAAAVLVVCGSANSKIERKFRSTASCRILSFPLPSGRDGYLATNSLIAFCALVARCFGYQLPTRSDLNKFEEISGLDSDLVTSYYLAIYGDWAKPAVLDLESKFSEAGLAAVLMADYRNFAHGRHNWIDKNPQSTTFVAFITPESKQLAQRTLKLLPDFIKVIHLSTEQEGAAGTLELLIKIFVLTAAVGRGRGIDPGRPQVPSYGGKLYNMPPKASRCKDRLADLSSAVERKLNARGSSNSLIERNLVETSSRSYIRSIRSVKFGSLVMDFDGTIVPAKIAGGLIDSVITEKLSNLLDEEIPIYFATGRGNSIHQILQKSFRREHWGKINICYYNGAKTLTLEEGSSYSESDFENILPIDEALEEVAGLLCNNLSIARCWKVSNKKCQIVIKRNQGYSELEIGKILDEIIVNRYRDKLRVVRSSHSIDIIPIRNSKTIAIDAASKMSKDNVLTIGDRGQLPGNDFDLLTHKFSLSVDQVSCDLESCWNYLPAGVRNVQGFVHYCQSFVVSDGSFKIDKIRKKQK